MQILENYIQALINKGELSVEELEQVIQKHKDNPNSIVEANKNIVLLADENANLIFQNAMQDMNIQSLQDENAELMFKIAMIEMGGNV